MCAVLEAAPGWYSMPMYCYMARASVTGSGGSEGGGEREIVGACESVGAHLIVSVSPGRIPFARGLVGRGGATFTCVYCSRDRAHMSGMCSVLPQCIDCDEELQIKTTTVHAYGRVRNT